MVISPSETEIFSLDKKQIQRQFERAARSYDEASDLQRKIVDEMHSRFDETRTKQPSGSGSYQFSQPMTLLDLGCGTGYGLSKIVESFGNAHSIAGIDLSRSMLELTAQTCPRAQLLQGDMEAIPLTNDCADIVFSSSSLQWCDLSSSITESARVIKPGGLFVASTFGPDTHIEWKQAWERLDKRMHTLVYPKLKTIEETMQAHNFDVIDSHTEVKKMTFESPLAALKSVKALGATNANRFRDCGLMGKHRFNQFVEAFKEISPNLSLTYEIFYLIGRKQI